MLDVLSSCVIIFLDITTLDGTWGDDAGRYGRFVRVGTPTNTGEQRGGSPMTLLHVVTADNRPSVADNVTSFSHPLTNGNPDALILWSVGSGRSAARRGRRRRRQ